MEGHKDTAKTCGWCEVESFVKEDATICPNCNKEGYLRVSGVNERNNK